MPTPEELDALARRVAKSSTATWDSLSPDDKLKARLVADVYGIDLDEKPKAEPGKDIITATRGNELVRVDKDTGEILGTTTLPPQPVNFTSNTTVLPPSSSAALTREQVEASVKRDGGTITPMGDGTLIATFPGGRYVEYNAQEVRGQLRYNPGAVKEPDKAKEADKPKVTAGQQNVLDFQRQLALLNGRGPGGMEGEETPQPQAQAKPPAVPVDEGMQGASRDRTLFPVSLDPFTMQESPMPAIGYGTGIESNFDSNAILAAVGRKPTGDRLADQSAAGQVMATRGLLTQQVGPEAAGRALDYNPALASQKREQQAAELGRRINELLGIPEDEPYAMSAALGPLPGFARGGSVRAQSGPSMNTQPHLEAGKVARLAQGPTYLQSQNDMESVNTSVNTNIARNAAQDSAQHEAGLRLGGTEGVTTQQIQDLANQILGESGFWDTPENRTKPSSGGFEGGWSYDMAPMLWGATDELDSDIWMGQGNRINKARNHFANLFKLPGFAQGGSVEVDKQASNMPNPPPPGYAPPILRDWPGDTLRGMRFPDLFGGTSMAIPPLQPPGQPEWETPPGLSPVYDRGPGWFANGGEVEVDENMFPQLSPGALMEQTPAQQGRSLYGEGTSVNPTQPLGGGYDPSEGMRPDLNRWNTYWGGTPEHQRPRFGDYVGANRIERNLQLQQLHDLLDWRPSLGAGSNINVNRMTAGNRQGAIGRGLKKAGLPWDNIDWADWGFTPELFADGGSMMLPEPTVGVGAVTGTPYFMAAENKPEMATVNGPQVNFTPQPGPEYGQQSMGQGLGIGGMGGTPPTPFAQAMELLLPLVKSKGRMKSLPVGRATGVA